MAIIDVWIQLENRAWDTMPNNIDRMTGKTAQDITGKASKDTVRFVNNDNETHSVEWDTIGSPVNSPIINIGGDFWDVVMSGMGTFNYHCGVHGVSMAGSITVVM